VADILSQTEIDALINAMVTSEQEGPASGNARSTGPTVAPKRVRQYDFRRPDKFSKDQLRTLQMIHENYIRPLQTYFAARFRTMVQMVVGSVDQNTYSEFVRGISSPSVIAPFTMSPLPGTCVFDINPVVAFPMLDRLFGGPGGAMPQNRALTEIETTVMQTVIQGCLEAYSEAWKSITAFKPVPGAIETNPLFVQVAAPNEIVLTIAMDVRIGEHVGVITICIPHLTLEPILDRLSAHNWFKTSGRDVKPEDLMALETRVGSAKVAVVAELGRAELTVAEVLDLSVGDVIMLETAKDDPVHVYVGNQPKFLARPGRLRGRLAIEIIGDTRKGDDEDE
jgi:flagellar motor switch protein FliM